MLSTPAVLHSSFISLQICLLDSPFPLFVRKISPEVISRSPINLRSLRQSFPGRRIMRTLPFSSTSARPSLAASAVMKVSSLTRIPVAQIVSIRSASRSFPCLRAAASSVS